MIKNILKNPKDLQWKKDPSQMQSQNMEAYNTETWEQFFDMSQPK